ncbi:MAG: ATPase domain-containing protein [Candidatus Micrarchaeota archaeon]
MAENNNDRVKTGINGLDELLHGGLRPGSISLISGTPGTGKTILALQYIYEGAKQFGEPGIFFTVEETAAAIRSYGDMFGWDIKAMEKKDLIQIVEQPIYESTTNQVALIPERIRNLGAKRVAIDSLTLLKYSASDALMRRVELFRLVGAIKASKCTALMTNEAMKEFPELDYSSEYYICDGNIVLFWCRNGQFFDKGMWVMKMRGQKIVNKVALMSIEDNGINVYPSEIIFGLENSKKDEK